MMIQQILPPQKPLLLHIKPTSEKIFSGNCRSFQDIPRGGFGAEKAGAMAPAFLCAYFHRPSGYLPAAVKAWRAAMTTGLSAA